MLSTFLEAPQMKYVPTPNHIQLCRQRELEGKQLNENNKYSNAFITLTSNEKTIKKAEQLLYMSAGWSNEISLGTVTRMQICQCVIDKRHLNMDGKHTNLLDKSFWTIFMRIKI